MSQRSLRRFWLILEKVSRYQGVKVSVSDLEDVPDVLKEHVSLKIFQGPCQCFGYS